MNVLIIEDEVNAFTYLWGCIVQLRPQAKLLSHVESVEDAVNWLDQGEAPDLIFMDIQLSDGHSFEIFDHIEVESPIIFATAYDEYAINAFKVNSIDYLLKPIHIDDLERAITKYERRMSGGAKVISDQFTEIFGHLNRQKKQRCLVKKGKHYEFIDIADISYVASDDGLTFIYTRDGHRHLYNTTVEALMASLDEKQFFQINRRQIINIDVIHKVHPYFNQRMKIDLQQLKTTDEFIVSRSKLSAFKSWMDS